LVHNNFHAFKINEIIGLKQANYGTVKILSSTKKCAMKSKAHSPLVFSSKITTVTVFSGIF
jgi:hypothetical protein